MILHNFNKAYEKQKMHLWYLDIHENMPLFQSLSEKEILVNKINIDSWIIAGANCPL